MFSETLLIQHYWGHTFIFSIRVCADESSSYFQSMASFSIFWARVSTFESAHPCLIFESFRIEFIKSAICCRFDHF